MFFNANKSAGGDGTQRGELEAMVRSCHNLPKSTCLMSIFQLLGMIQGTAENVDLYVSDDMRNFLGSKNGRPGSDIASRNIMRGRDHGLQDYNSVRVKYGLQPIETFSDFPADTQTSKLLARMYSNNISTLDVWVGGLAENKHGNLAAVGPLFANIIRTQFLRIRDSDRFWFERGSQSGLYTENEIADIRATSLKDIITRNTLLTDEVFSQSPWRAVSVSTAASSQASIELGSAARTLSWEVDRGFLIFSVKLPKSDTFLGIGFGCDSSTPNCANDGAMKDADMVIFQLIDSKIKVDDYFSNGYNKPAKDAQQDYVVISSEVNLHLALHSALLYPPIST